MFYIFNLSDAYNNNISLIEEDKRIFDLSFAVLELSSKINIFSTLFVICIGLFGNCLTIFVFGQSRFRKNSSHIYLLALALIDSLFLLIHFFEDVIRTFKDIYLQHSDINIIIKILNIIDQFEILCRFCNYMRYFLRFISAYIVVCFTIQRLSIVYKPLSRNFATKSSAWKTVLIITLISTIINIWVPFLFEIQITETKVKYCDINKEYKTIYFRANVIYIFLIMVIPMINIFICNLLIISKTNKNDRERKVLRLIIRADPPRKPIHSKSISIDTNSKPGKLKPHYLTLSQLIKKNKKRTQNNSRKITLLLIFISFSYIFLNLPYLISWLVYSYDEAFNHLDLNTQNYLFTLLQVSEVFYVLNYAIKFFIYCASGSTFNNQLKYSSKCLFFL
jgi:hypothetical protein